MTLLPQYVYFYVDRPNGEGVSMKMDRNTKNTIILCTAFAVFLGAAIAAQAYLVITSGWHVTLFIDFIGAAIGIAVWWVDYDNTKRSEYFESLTLNELRFMRDSWM